MACWVWCQCLEQIMAAVGVDFIEADKQIRFAMGTGYVARRQDLHPAATIPANDFLSPRLNLAGNDRICSDQLFRQIEIVSNLTFVIGEDETIVSLPDSNALI